MPLRMTKDPTARKCGLQIIRMNLFVVFVYHSVTGSEMLRRHAQGQRLARLGVLQEKKGIKTNALGTKTSEL